MNVNPGLGHQVPKFTRRSVSPALRGSWKGGGCPRFEAPTARVLLGEMEGPVDRRYTAVVSPYLTEDNNERVSISFVRDCCMPVRAVPGMRQERIRIGGNRPRAVEGLCAVAGSGAWERTDHRGEGRARQNAVLRAPAVQEPENLVRQLPRPDAVRRGQ